MLISLMLVCAILASLAFGVLAAYGSCLAFFRLISGQARAHPALDPAAAKAKA
jgi:hypothetical protein